MLLPVILNDRPDQIVLARWGFVPEWAEHSKRPLRPQNNARVEGIDEKPMFRDSYRTRHCLVLADGFFEWNGFATSDGHLHDDIPLSRQLLIEIDPRTIGGHRAELCLTVIGQPWSVPTLTLIKATSQIARVLEQHPPALRLHRLIALSSGLLLERQTDEPHRRSGDRYDNQQCDNRAYPSCSHFCPPV